MHHDLHGNLTKVTDEFGALVGCARYNALGETIYSTIPPTLTARLPGGAHLDADADNWYLLLVIYSKQRICESAANPLILKIHI